MDNTELFLDKYKELENAAINAFKLDMVLDRIKNPVRCMDIAVPFNDLVWRSLDDPVMPVIRIMNDRNISHVPILKDKRVVGDFSDNCIFPYLLGDTN